MAKFSSLKMCSNKKNRNKKNVSITQNIGKESVITQNIGKESLGA